MGAKFIFIGRSKKPIWICEVQARVRTREQAAAAHQPPGERVHPAGAVPPPHPPDGAAHHAHHPPQQQHDQPPDAEHGEGLAGPQEHVLHLAGERQQLAGREVLPPSCSTSEFQSRISIQQPIEFTVERLLNRRSGKFLRPQSLRKMVKWLRLFVWRPHRAKQST